MLKHGKEIKSKNLSFRINGAAFHQRFIYVLGQERVHILNASLELIGGFEHGAQSPYAIHLNDYGIFIADVKDYISKGEVLHFGWDHTLIQQVQTGYIPQAMLEL